MRDRRARLQTRIFLWFIAAIVLAIGAGAASVMLLHEPSDAPTGLVARAVQGRLAHVWDDPRATDAYVAELRESTGLDVVLHRDIERLPREVRFAGPRRGSIVFEGGSGFIPVVKNGAVVGALEVRTKRARRPVWHLALVVIVVLLVLGAASRRVSVRLSGPLVEIARAAERFGHGELSARTRLDEGRRRRWVAAEVRNVGRSFDSMAERIERMVLDQRELLGAISHELRSPLGRARVALEIAKERTPSGSDKSLAVVERELGNVDAILGDLLTAARAGLSDLRREKLTLVPWIEERLAADPDGCGEVRVTATPAAREARLQGDGPLLWRAISNVVRNARMHGHPDDAPVELDLDVKDGRVHAVISDRGPGFSPDVLPRAFEPFVRKDAAARTPGAAKSTGLGLALVRRIAQAHGGSARAANREGGGAVVTLELPIVTATDSQKSER